MYPNMRRAIIVLLGLLGLGLTGVAGDSLYEAPLDTRKTTAARLVGGVTTARTPEGLRIGFEVSGYTDVEVALLDKSGKVVRHLAAGLLGPHAPAPLRAAALKQELLWDGRDDAGRTVPGMEPAGAPTEVPRVRVRIGDAGLGVDARGNVYVGVNVKPSSGHLPAAVRGKVPEANWLGWVQRVDQFREPPWYYSMRNEYIYHYGSVMKFGPEGGTMYGRSPGASLPFIQSGGGRGRAPEAFAENGPPDAPVYRSGYLYHAVKVKGAQWRFAGTGIVPASERYWGDAACVCYFSRLDTDPYGRVFAPDCFQFRVHILDGAGNLIGNVGTYGNSGDAAADGKQPRLAWPAFVHAGVDGKMYVSDALNGGIVVVGFDYADEAQSKP
jgi:hypothetical protein